jgi:hypothetical protein
MVIVAMAISFALHCRAKLLGILGFHCLMIIESVWICLCKERDHVHHPVRNLRLKVSRQHLISSWECNVAFLHVVLDLP